MTRTTAIVIALVAALVVAGTCGVSTRGINAEGPPAKPVARPTRVAVINTASLINNHPPLKDALAKLKAEIGVAEKRVKQDRERTREIVRQLKTLPPGSPQTAALLEELDRIINPPPVNPNKDSLQREAATHCRGFRQIWQAVEAYCRENEIDLVLRVADKTRDNPSPDEVVWAINREVVWFAPRLDITPVIAERLSRPGAGNPPAAGNQAAVDGRAAPRAERLKAAIGAFRLSLDFSGEEAKPFYRLTLTVAPVPNETRERTSLFDRKIQITEAQARKIIDYLALREYFLQHAMELRSDAELPPLPPYEQNYVMIVSGGDFQFWEDWGWGPVMRRRLARLQGVLEGDAAKAMDFLQERLGGALGPAGDHTHE